MAPGNIDFPPFEPHPLLFRAGLMTLRLEHTARSDQAIAFRVLNAAGETAIADGVATFA